MKDYIQLALYLALFWFGYFTKHFEIKQKVTQIKEEIEQLKKLLKIKS